MSTEVYMNIVELNRDISNKLIDSFYLLEILEELSNYDAKEGILLSLVKNNIKSAFDNIEKCRSMISIT